MASAQDYAAWIVANRDKQGTPEFDTVASAYKIVRSAPSTPPQSQPQTTSDATASDRIKALQGGLYTGAARLAGLPMDTVENTYNLGKAAFGTAATALGRPDLAPDLTQGTPLGSESILNAMNKIGINTANPAPKDTTSQMLNTGGMIAGSSISPGMGIKQTVIPAISGAIAEQIDPRLTGLGAIAPAAATQVATAAKNAIAANAAPIVNTFKQAGAMPSVGQATDNVFLHGLENLAAKFPGGAGVMQKFIENQQKSLGARARTGVSTEDAGRAIEKGVTGEGGFLDRTKSTWNKLDDLVAKKIPAGSAYQPSNTIQALDDLTRPVRGAEKTTGALVNPKIAEMRNNLSADLQANNGKVPFEALRALRSKVGSMLDNALVTGIPGGELKKVYGALSKDLGAAATQAGAGGEFARQNNYYRARMSRIENVLERVIGKGKQPEDIFKAFNPTDPDQANKVRSVLRSLSPAERQVVSEAAVNRLGKATPGKQNEFGETFSSETFLTNWNKLSPGAKAQLFPDAPLRDNVNKMASAAAQIRSGKGIYANPSGTAGSFAAYSVYASPIAALATGSMAPLLAAGGAAGSALIGAKMMTNPKVVEWLAKPVNPTRPRDAVMHLVRLGVIYNNTKDAELKDELGKYISAVGNSQEKTAQ